MDLVRQNLLSTFCVSRLLEAVNDNHKNYQQMKYQTQHVLNSQYIMDATSRPCTSEYNNPIAIQMPAMRPNRGRSCVKSHTWLAFCDYPRRVF